MLVCVFEFAVVCFSVAFVVMAWYCVLHLGATIVINPEVFISNLHHGVLTESDNQLLVP